MFNNDKTENISNFKVKYKFLRKLFNKEETENL